MAQYCYVNENNPYFITGEKYQQKNPYSLILKIELFITPFLLFFFALTFYPVFSSAKTNQLVQTPIHNEQQILGVTTDETISPTTTPLSTITPTVPIVQSPTPELTSPPSKSHTKNSYSIAVYGDSMVDTMGEVLEYLEHSLKKTYPSVNFKLYNYGKGAQNVEVGFARWNERFDYQDRHYPAITEVKPDIIIIASFAYNPFSPYDRDRHWIGLTKLAQQAQSISQNVYMLSEIAPLRSNFGKGPMGVNYDENTAYTHSGWIVEQLENAVGLSKTLNIPLIDVYHQSIGQSGLTNPSDGIHPSVLGHEFTADIIVNTIKLN